MDRAEAVSFMTAIAGEHLIEVPAADNGTDVDLDALVGACAERFNLQRESVPLELWNWAIDAAARYFRTRPEPAS